MTHTPESYHTGPLAVGAKPDLTLYVVNAGNVIIADNIEGKDFAFLIAAAPDLLEALEAACDDLEQATLTQIAAKHHGLAQASQESLDTARAAIAKAKGTPEAGI